MHFVVTVVVGGVFRLRNASRLLSLFMNLREFGWQQVTHLTV
jgi:hypothetical protein